MGNYHAAATRQAKQQLRNPYESDEEIMKRSSRDPFGNPFVDRNSNYYQLA